MKQKLFLLFILVTQINFSQTLKIYNGDYETGKASYQYYENSEYERIFNGSFRYNKNRYCTIIGNYIENKQIGEWTYINNFGGIDQNYTKISGRYKNGMKNGLWTYYSSKIVNKQKRTFSTSINYINDTIVGKINVAGLTGEFDQKGNFIGKWSCKSNDIEYIAEFNDNMVVKLIERKISDGKISAKYSPVLEAINFEELTDSSHKYNRTSFSTNNTSKIKSFIDVYGSTDNGNSSETEQFFKRFLKNIEDKIYSLQSGIYNGFILLNQIIIRNPELITINNKTLIDNTVKVDKVIEERILNSAGMELQPEFPGGMNKFYQYINNNLQQADDENSISVKKMIVQFVVDFDGSLTDIKVIQGIDFNTDKKAINVFQKSPKWLPGIVNNKTVRVSYSIPLNVSIDNN